MTDRRADIPALTGLRFLAALFVAVPHISLTYMRGEGGHLLPEILNLSSIGMTIFFVLSGFVIHYNYGQSLMTGGGRALARFLVARFARLYPLFFVAVGLELALGPFMRHALYGAAVERHAPEALPAYLTMTQSWFFTLWEGHAPIYQYGQVASVTWSISTEWFFYLAFPLACPLVWRLRRARSVVAGLLAVSAAALLALVALWRLFPAIDAFGVARFGVEAALVYPQDSFFRWLTYFSPYARLPEFLLGCLLAQLHLVAPGRWPVAAERVLGLAALAALALLGLATQLTTGLLSDLPRMAISSLGLGPPVAALVLFAAHRQGLVSRLLGHPWAVAGGELSYGIYMLHQPVLLALGAPVVAAGASPWPNLVAMGVVLAAILVLAAIAHHGLELPARRWLRRVLAPEGRWGRPVAWGGGGVLALSAALTLVHLAAPFTTASPLPQGVITTVRAIYGANCSPRDATRQVAAACNGKASCAFTVRVEELGDPAPGCAKGFDAVYACGPDGRGQAVSLPPEAGLGSVAALSCARSPR